MKNDGRKILTEMGKNALHFLGVRFYCESNRFYLGVPSSGLVDLIFFYFLTVEVRLFAFTDK